MGFLAHWLAARQPDVVACRSSSSPTRSFRTPSSRGSATAPRCTARRAGTASRSSRASRSPTCSRVCPGSDFGARLDQRARRGALGDERLLPERQGGLAPRLPAQARLVRRARGALGGAPSRRRARAAVRRLQRVPAALDSWNEAGFCGADLPHRSRARALPRAARSRARRRVPRAHSRRRRSRGGTIAAARSTSARACASTSCSARARVERVTAVEIDRDYRKKQDGLTASDHAPVIRGPQLA